MEMAINRELRSGLVILGPGRIGSLTMALNHFRTIHLFRSVIVATLHSSSGLHSCCVYHRSTLILLHLRCERQHGVH